MDDVIVGTAAADTIMGIHRRRAVAVATDARAVIASPVSARLTMRLARPSTPAQIRGLTQDAHRWISSTRPRIPAATAGWRGTDGRDNRPRRRAR